MRAGIWLATLLGSSSAVAGRTDFGWLFGTELVPERTIELSSALYEENQLTPDRASETRWWLAPVIGVTDRLELALPVEFAKDRTASGATELDRYGAELRYRLEAPDPLEPVVPLVRIAVNRLVAARDAVNPQADLVVSYANGRLHAVVDLGGYAELRPHAHYLELRPGAGASVAVTGELRAGAEVFAELPRDAPGRWAVVGPNVAWTHGRFWLSAAYGVGIFGIKDAPRVQWGIAF